jgi:hypothetical protein
MRKAAAINRFQLMAVAFVCSLSSFILIMPTPAIAQGGLNNRSIKLGNDTVSANTQYGIQFDITKPAVTLGSVELEFCANDPLPNTACTIPTGLDLSSIILTNQFGNTGFSRHANSTANKVILTRFPILPTAGTTGVEFLNVINPDTQGSYYVRMQTFSSNDATGGSIEDGGLVFAITNAFNVTAEVPPYLRFCTSVTIVGFDCSTATSFLIDLGEFSKTHATAASSEYVVATNAGLGYSITMSGTTLTSGNNIIPPLAAPSSSNPGNGQFGINLRANSNPSIGVDPNGPGVGTISAGYGTPNNFKFASGDVVSSSTGSTDNRKYTVSYLTNVGNNEVPGVYATTISFICLANF